jgi:predicted CopG family antitoxin
MTTKKPKRKGKNIRISDAAYKALKERAKKERRSMSVLIEMLAGV